LRGATLTTGAEGFVGSHLVPLLEGRGHEVAPVRRPDRAQPGYGRGWRAVDLRDPQACAALVRDVRPARVVHLAAVAFPPDAERDPLEALRANYVAVDALARALAAHAPSARLLFVGSGEVYGGAPVGAPPFAEDAPLAPRTPYAATKAAAEMRVALAVADEGLDALSARPFNHTGPGRPERYAESSFARQLAAIERGQAEPVIRVGDLEAVRDFSDVRDVVQAYALLLERGERGTSYNVASGVGRRLGDVLDALVARARCAVRVEVDPARLRASEPERQALVGSPARLRALGWRPAHAFEETLGDLLESWRAAA
jgi:GDP-4-dehydro-6-deoxy-D-mannose reductase